MPDRYDVEWTTFADADLDAIVEYIAADSPSNALAVLRDIRASAESLEILPLRGRRVQELVPFGVTYCRQLIVVPWRVVYRIVQKKVYVLAVVDSRRQLEDVLMDRLARM